jgi:ADP-heptose:LPS heptosyltransferase
VVTRFAGIGDVICLLPAAAKLKGQHPNSALIFVTSRTCAPLVDLSGVADLVVPSFVRGRRWLIALLRPGLNLSPLLPDELTPKQPRARIHLIHEFARVLGVGDSSLRHPDIEASARDIADVRRRLEALTVAHRPFAVIHTGPTWPVKQWPQSHWERLVAQLKSSGLEVIQVGATRDDRDTAPTAPPVPGAHDLRDRLSLPQTLALLGFARVFVGIDSGMLHLASAAGTAVVGIFGPTDPHCFLPARENALGLSEKVDCLGCHHHPDGERHWRSGCPHDVRCMSLLSAEKVLEPTLAAAAEHRQRPVQK